jgi:hypothetical protein
MTSTEPIRWEDRTGRVRWQPQLNGQVRVAHPIFAGDSVWTHSDDGPPRLCRWRWRAVRIARREQRRRDRWFQRVMRPTKE